MQLNENATYHRVRVEQFDAQFAAIQTRVLVAVCCDDLGLEPGLQDGELFQWFSSEPRKWFVVNRFNEAFITVIGRSEITLGVGVDAIGFPSSMASMDALHIPNELKPIEEAALLTAATLALLFSIANVEDSNHPADPVLYRAMEQMRQAGFAVLDGSEAADA